MTSTYRILASALLTGALAGPALAGDGDAAARQILSTFHAGAAMEDLDFKGFEAARGQTFYHDTHRGGRAPSCTTCHGQDPTQAGALPGGGPIPPLAPSANPERMSDTSHYLKQIRGCCNITLGRDCSARQKGDVTTYLMEE